MFTLGFFVLDAPTPLLPRKRSSVVLSSQRPLEGCRRSARNKSSTERYQSRSSAVRALLGSVQPRVRGALRSYRSNGRRVHLSVVHLRKPFLAMSKWSNFGCRDETQNLKLSKGCSHEGAHGGVVVSKYPGLSGLSWGFLLLQSPVEPHTPLGGHVAFEGIAVGEERAGGSHGMH